MKNDRSYRWFVRITAPHEHCKAKYTELKNNVDYVNSAIGYHIGTKTGKAHCHIAITLRTEPQKQSIDVRLKKLFDVKGSDYSSKVWDGNYKVLSYLYHDKGGEVTVDMPLTEAERQEIQRTSEVYETIVTQAKTKSSGRIVDATLEAMGDVDWSQRDILMYILNGVHEERWHKCSDFQLLNYVDEIRLKTKQETWRHNRDAIIHRIISRAEKF